MAKFYCTSGPFQAIIDAPDVDTLCRKFVKRLIKSNSPHTLFLTIGEQSFDRVKHQPRSLVPFLREANVNLPPDDYLIQYACKALGLTTLNEKQSRWVLYGEEWI